MLGSWPRVPQEVVERTLDSGLPTQNTEFSFLSLYYLATSQKCILGTKPYVYCLFHNSVNSTVAPMASSSGSLMVKKDMGPRRPGFKFWIHCLLAVWPWAKVIPLNLSFFIFMVRTITHMYPKGIVRIQWDIKCLAQCLAHRKHSITIAIFTFLGHYAPFTS